MKYTFEVIDRATIIHPVPIDLPDEEAAHLCAKDIARQLLSNGSFSEGPSLTDWRIVMFDEGGKMVVDIKLSEALNLGQDRL